MTGTRIRSALSKIARLSGLYDGWRSTITKSVRPAGDVEGRGHPLRVEEVGVDRAGRHRQHLEAGRVQGGLLVEGQDRATLQLVAPRVDDRRGAVHAERDRHVTGDRVRVDQQDALPAGDQDGGEVGGDRGLAHAALGVEHGDQLAPPAPVAGLELALEDRAAAVVHGDRADAHRLDAPADRFGGVGARQVLVVVVARRRPVDVVERRGIDHEERRDVPALLMEQRPRVGPPVGLPIRVHDRNRHVPPDGQEDRQLVRVGGQDRLEPAHTELADDGFPLRRGQQDRDGRAAGRGAHGVSPLPRDRAPPRTRRRRWCR